MSQIINIESNPISSSGICYVGSGSTVTTTVPPTTEAPTTTLKPVEVFYSLHRCDTMENTYETGPLAEGTYSSGDRVEGATGIYYVVNGSQNASFGHTNIMVTGTGEISCP